MIQFQNHIPAQQQHSVMLVSIMQHPLNILITDAEQLLSCFGCIDGPTK